MSRADTIEQGRMNLHNEPLDTQADHASKDGASNHSGDKNASRNLDSESNEVQCHLHHKDLCQQQENWVNLIDTRPN